jgi:hypothetical protein
MNARLLTRTTPSIARQLIAPRVSQPVAVTKRFASSEAIGADLVSERNHHKDHAGSESLL